MIHGYWISQVVRAAADLRLADHLAAGPLTAQEVAGLESSDPLTTGRLMRTCAALGLLARGDDGRFAVTSTGALLQSGVPGSLRDHAPAFGAPGHWLPWGQLPAEPGGELAGVPVCRWAGYSRPNGTRAAARSRPAPRSTTASCGTRRLGHERWPSGSGRVA